MNFIQRVVINPKITMEKGKVYPFIEMANVSTSYRDPISIDQKQFDSGVKFQDGDTVIARITPCLQNGKRFYCHGIGTGFGSTEYLVFRPKDDTVDNLYLYYFMQTDFIKQSMINSMTGATGRQRVNNDVFNDIEISFPEISTQRKIGEVLSSFDSLIENNQKQIKLLEEAAQRLYKEWFVDLRLPGYETTPVVDGVPEGWTKKTVLQCLELHIGGGWGKETIVGKNTIPGKVIRGTDINDIKAGNFKDVPLRYHTENDKKKRALKTNDIVFELSNGNINNIGRSLLVDDLILKKCGENTICASFCKLFRPLDRLHALVLYLEIQDMQASGRMMPFKKQGSNGINNFAFEDFLTHELLVPNDYSMLAPLESIMSKISIIQSQFSLLSQARDRLLPKLMSGEIEV
jgi:type I restriction enzyme S subunit